MLDTLNSDENMAGTVEYDDESCLNQVPVEKLLSFRNCVTIGQ